MLESLDEDQQMHVFASPNVMLTNCSKNVLTQDLQQKIIKQVEYQFSGLSLLANESLVKHISKDPEGYVPISVIASMKKIKSCITNNNLLAQALRSSSKLVVSNDGKKVRRKHPFTEKDKEELQSRTVVGENLPEDHSHQNLEKIFSVVGRLLQNNRILGPLPVELGRLPKLQTLDLSNNMLTGEIPPSLANIKTLQYLEEVCMGNLKRFQFRELQHATGNFTSKNILGKGGFEIVYKGVLSDGTVVAVKGLKDGNAVGGVLSDGTVYDPDCIETELKFISHVCSIWFWVCWEC